MKRRHIGLAMGAMMVLGAALSLPSCGHDQKLVSLTIQPAAFTFLEPYSPPPGNATEQYRAIGTYIHPPATIDVTSQATWKIDDGVVTMSSGNISATLPEGTGGSSNIVTAYATVTVDNPTVVNCPGYGSAVTLSVQVTGPGSVTSTALGINCPGQCIATVAVGASVGLTAVPLSGSTVTWSSACTSSSGNNCSVTIPAGGADVLATFNAP